MYSGVEDGHLRLTTRLVTTRLVTTRLTTRLTICDPVQLKRGARSSVQGSIQPAQLIGRFKWLCGSLVRADRESEHVVQRYDEVSRSCNENPAHVQVRIFSISSKLPQEHYNEDHFPIQCTDATCRIEMSEL
ncbi:uncharacterized protein [Montipora foliosa]|uniref:uncharacterized protein n=1 Tax=Montipora foliosa TaxID=591990 RepID=UPI0035F12EB4